jgi:hypothetical protein
MDLDIDIGGAQGSLTRRVTRACRQAAMQDEVRKMQSKRSLVSGLALCMATVVAGCATPPFPDTSARPEPSAMAAVPTATPAVPPGASLSTPSVPAGASPTAATVTPSPSSRSVTGTPTPRPTSTATHPATLSWDRQWLPLTRTPFGPGDPDEFLGGADIAAGGPGFVVVGVDQDSTGRKVQVSWTSADGLAWQEHASGIAIPAGPLPVRSYALGAVAAHGDDVVAVGPVGIWHSTDGASWQRVADFAFDLARRADVDWGSNGFVAMGPLDDASPLVATSPDGRSWVRVPASAPLVGFCVSRVAGSRAGYVAIGSDCADPGRMIIVASADGRDWIRAPLQPSLAGDLRAVSGVASGGPGWIAFGYFRPAGSDKVGIQTWTSADGIAWRRGSFLRPIAPYVKDCGNVQATMSDLVPFGHGYVAVGVSRCSNEYLGAAWASPDGAAWHSIRYSDASEEEFFGGLERVVAHGDRLVAIGRGPFYDYLPAIYTAEQGR